MEPRDALKVLEDELRAYAIGVYLPLQKIKGVLLTRCVFLSTVTEPAKTTFGKIREQNPAAISSHHISHSRLKHSQAKRTPES